MFSVSSWPKAIAHIDADAFFVECERATNPYLKDRCVATGKERGIITALSYEAKAKGIKRGMMVYEAKRICPEIVIIESDYEKYSLFSIRMFDILRRFSPVVEEYSVDEAFMDLTGLRRLYHSSYEKIAKTIQETIKRELDISVSIGIAPTKVLAKLGSKLNKPYGITAIKAKEIHIYLKNIRVEDIWGIGKNTAALLYKFNIKTALDFANQNEYFIRRYLSKPYIAIYKELKGESVIPIDEKNKTSYKSISKAKSFHKAINDKDILLGELINNLEKACQKARRYKLAAKRLIVFLKTDDFKTYTAKIKLKTASNIPNILTDSLKSGFMSIYKENTSYRQTGVALAELTTKTMYDLFDNIDRIKKANNLYEAVDKINATYGTKTIRLARSDMAVEKKKGRKKPNVTIMKDIKV